MFYPKIAIFLKLFYLLVYNFMISMYLINFKLDLLILK